MTVIFSTTKKEFNSSIVLLFHIFQILSTSNASNYQKDKDNTSEIKRMKDSVTVINW